MADAERSRVDPIVVGVDGSPGAERALEWAAHEAERRHAPLLVVACWSYPSFMWGASVPLLRGDQLERGAREVAEAQLARVRDRGGIGAVVTLEVTEGAASLRLLDYEDAAQLIVVGSRGRGGFTGLLLGSVGQHLAEHARCPVVIVRP